ncbi:AT-hook motif nuclear-localized protein 17 [Hibiscus syriacus]|uniref:AT-hook motif nuclear-localized protein n=1 Tax=Hibiscus syriacus TaxID=106335 RepID=A0A6A2XXR7_HIBSY|nr:AT-hook motif nuclear-localized protein 17-like [Hibiscus syriacus]KAE8659244.1 AT-hook motif nuclear-localized protein 17 [Hibiscus syriacus]
MKGEYVEPQNRNTINMFSKLHHHHHQQQQPQHQTHPFSYHFQLSRDSQKPDSDDTTHTPNHAPKDLSTTTAHSPSLLSGGSGGGSARGGDGASIEIVRRPRGRPPGSKNKPKPPVVITHEPDPAMSPYILEIPGGNDIVEAVSRFSRRKNIGICLLTGSGTVSNVTLRQPSSATPAATITFHGIFDILSLSATFLSQTTSCHVPNTVSISLAGPQGQVVGGFVAGPLVAAGNVFIVAATFNNPLYHRIPGEEEGRNTVSSGVAGGQSPPLSGGGGDSSHGGGADSCGVSMYNSHLGGSDVIWAPTARPPPPPPPY